MVHSPGIWLIPPPGSAVGNTIMTIEGFFSSLK